MVTICQKSLVNMSNSSKLKRVMTEAWLVVALAEISILLSLPYVAPQVSPLLGGLLNMALLVSICAPVIYWRFSALFKDFEQPLGPAGAHSLTSSAAVKIAVLAQIMGLLLTAGGVWLQGQKLDKFSAREFDRVVERTQIEMVRRLNQALYGINGAKAAMAAHPNFKRNEFRDYVAARGMSDEFPGIRGFGFIQPVPRDQLQAFIAAERADNAPDFSVMTTGVAPELYVIKYVEPLAANRVARGFDVWQEPIRRAALERAIDTGEPALSGAVQLVQDQSRTPGVMYFVPVYQQNSAPKTVAERRRDLVGLLYAPIVAAELYSDIELITNHWVNFALFEGALDQSEQLIFNSDHGRTLGDGGDATIDAVIGKFTDLRALNVGGHPFLIRFNSSPIFEAAQDRSSLTYIGVSGVLLSLLVAVTVWLLAVGRQRALSTAAAMTAELNRMAQVVQHTDSAVSIMDRQRQIVWINPGFTRITGYTLADSVGKTADQLLNSGKSDPLALETLLSSFDGKAPCRVELINRGKQGREYWTDVEQQPLFDDAGQWVGYMEISQDITARKQVEDALKVSNALMEETQAVAKVGGWSLDLMSNDLYWSAETYRIHGASPQTFSPKVDTVVGYFTPASRERVTVALQAAVQRGEGFDLELETHTAHGQLIQIRTTGTATLENGKPVRLSGIFQDITERKNYESSLMEARIAAELATQSKGEFLANMSHELRTPMNAILGMLTLLGHTPLSVNQRDYVTKTEGAAKSLLGLLNSILDFSKMEAGKMELDPQPFRLDRLMRDLAVVLSANVGTKNIEVLYEIDPGLPPCLLGDAMRLQQVLINLAGNAVKFTSVGQVVISIKLDAALAESPEVAQVVFAVQDSGIGIAPENQAKIFTGFSQAEASTSRRFGGTGLGLAISQRLVALMGGQVELTSALGVGSTFSFRLSLPVVTPDADTPEARVVTPSPEVKHVLVIDDNTVSRDIMANILRSFGWQVAEAHSGQAGLDLIKSAAQNGVFPYQCIYLDWQMPEMDGWETMQHVRVLAQRLSGPPPRIIMLSANTRDNLAQRTLLEQEQISAFLMKPITASLLLEASLTPLVTGRATQIAPPSSQRRLEGLRVLVVEDNMINQQVAEELLTLEGALVSIASDGQQGVNAVASATPPFDVVLMDVQMPIMDGYAATRTIREKLGLSCLPIIGLTANAMAADRQACLEAGMNDHVGKPFNMTHLVALMHKLTAKQAVSPDVTGL